MKVGIITSPLIDANSVRGVGKYTRLLLDGLAKYGQSRNIEVFSASTADELRGKVDLIHFPFFDLFRLTLPYQKFCPTVVTVHDLIPIVYREHFSIGLRGWVKWWIQKKSLLNVDKIITVSNASKHDIAYELGFSESKIEVIYSYASDNYRLQTQKQLDSVRTKLHLPQEYLLYVGDINWNKNISGLLRVFCEIKKDVEFKDLKLVLVGKAFNNHEIIEAREIDQTIKELRLDKEVLKLGFVDDLDMPAIYGGALTYVQLSWVEGFGLPILEAMKCGTLAVGSNRGGIKEILRPTDTVNPENMEETVKVIKQVMRLTTDEKEAVIKLNLEWVKRFNSEKFTKQIIGSYEKTLRGN